MFEVGQPMWCAGDGLRSAFVEAYAMEGGVAVVYNDDLEFFVVRDVG